MKIHHPLAMLARHTQTNTDSDICQTGKWPDSYFFPAMPAGKNVCICLCGSVANSKSIFTVNWALWFLCIEIYPMIYMGWCHATYDKYVSFLENFAPCIWIISTCAVKKLFKINHENTKVRNKNLKVKLARPSTDFPFVFSIFRAFVIILFFLP